MDSWMLTFLFVVTDIRLTLATQECSNGEACIPTNQFEIKVTIDGKDIEVDWKFNHSKRIYGFQTRVYKSDSSVVYQSPMLHESERSMILQQELEGQSEICVIAYENSTKILDEKCENIKITDLKIIIGILAGVIFLIPCIIGISYVIYKDLKVQTIEYEKIDSKLDGEKSVEHKEFFIDETKEVFKADMRTPKEVSKTDMKMPKEAFKTDTRTPKEVSKTDMKMSKETSKTDMKMAKEASKTDMKMPYSTSTTDNKAFVMDEDLKQSKDSDQITQKSNMETFTVNKRDTKVSGEASEKSDEENRRLPESGSKSLSGGSEIEEDKFEEIKTDDEVAVNITDEEVSGTAL